MISTGSSKIETGNITGMTPAAKIIGIARKAAPVSASTNMSVMHWIFGDKFLFLTLFSLDGAPILLPVARPEVFMAKISLGMFEVGTCTHASKFYRGVKLLLHIISPHDSTIVVCHVITRDVLYLYTWFSLWHRGRSSFRLRSIILSVTPAIWLIRTFGTRALYVWGFKRRMNEY